MDINKAILIGRLVKDAELRHTVQGVAKCYFVIAINKQKVTGEEDPHFFEICLWGKQGENLSNYLVQGKLVAIEGELHQDKWINKGTVYKKVVVVASNVQIINEGKQPREKDSQKDFLINHGQYSSAMYS